MFSLSVASQPSINKKTLIKKTKIQLGYTVLQVHQVPEFADEVRPCQLLLPGPNNGAMQLEN